MQSCFLNIDFKIAEDVPVYEAIKRMAANRIGALAVTATSDSTKIIGIVSERDYLTKVALLGKSSKTTPIIQICTHGEANLVTVNEDDSVDACMKKVRHLGLQTVHHYFTPFFVHMILITATPGTVEEQLQFLTSTIPKFIFFKIF